MSDQKKNDHPLEDMLSQLQDALSQATEAAGRDQGTTGDEQAAAPGEQQISDLLPVLPVRDVVVFNYMILPLFIGREKSVRAVEAALKKGRHLLVCTQKEESTEDPGPNDLYTAGTVVQVMRMLKMPDGRIKILVQGASRARVEGYHRVEPYLEARITVLQEETPPRDAKIEALLRSAREQSEKVLQLRGVASPDILAVLQGVDEPGRLADLIAANLRMKTADAQRILEAVNPVERLMLVNIQLEREVEVATMQAHIQSTAREGMDKAQKEYFLREQIKAIRHELGDAASEGEEELDELRKALDKASLPKEVRKEADKQLRRLSGMHADSSEANVVRTYLDWLVELPWKKLSRDRLDIAHAKAILDEDHYGLDKIKDRILEFLSVRKLNPQSKGPILCFAGPPGVGKTSLGRSIARALGRHFQRLSLGGMHDEAEIRGHRRTYIGAMPGRIIQAIKQAGTRNPVIVLDEVDKLGSDFRGDPSSALLEVLDPEQNHTFSDHYLNVPFDLSRVMFLCTANHLETIPAPLRDRMEVISLPGYTMQEKVEIAKRHLLPKKVAENGLQAGDVVMDDTAITTVIRGYTREAGLRNLERELGAICRKLARQRAEGKKGSFYRGQRRGGKAAGRAALHRGREGQAPHARHGPGPGLDPGRRRGADHRMRLHEGQGQPAAHGPAGRRHEGKRPHRHELHPQPGRQPGHRRGLQRHAGHPHPCACRCRPQGRPLRRCHPDLGPDLGPERPHRAGRYLHDRRDHPAGPGAARGRHQGKDPGRCGTRAQACHHPRPERQGSGRGPQRTAEKDQGPPRAHL